MFEFVRIETIRRLNAISSQVHFDPFSAEALLCLSNITNLTANDSGAIISYIQQRNINSEVQAN